MKISYRPPVIGDGTRIWALVRRTGVLDANSVYCYLLLCKDFAETCVVAEADGDVLGFVTAYLKPGREDLLFIWQVGVAPELHGQGVASRLLDELLQREHCRAVRYLETTITPSNTASHALFKGFARRLNTNLSEQTCFDTVLFPGNDHEPENLIRIGPLQDNRPDQTSNQDS